MKIIDGNLAEKSQPTRSLVIMKSQVNILLYSSNPMILWRWALSYETKIYDPSLNVEL